MIEGVREESMKILAVSGSPREGGNSDTAARTALSACAALGETAFLRLADYEIRHCRGCTVCLQGDGCAIRDDDLNRLLARWMEAELVLLCTPVYWLSPPGIVKNFIDRTLSVSRAPEKPFAGQKIVLVTVAEENGFELQNELLSRWLRHYGAHIVAMIDLTAGGRHDLQRDSRQLRRLKDSVAAALGGTG
jgi:multimeric flavodoxin WrbA